MKIYSYIFPLTLILYLIKINPSYSFNVKEILDNPNNYRNLLCSGNGEPYYNATSNEVICSCKEGYTNEPNNKKKKYLNNHLIQCSYRRKSRFTVLFYSLCLPFGFDFLYLGRYKIFAVVFCIILLVITLNIVLFFINYKINMKNQEKKNQNKLNKMRNYDGNKESNEDKKYRIIRILNIIGNIGLFNHILYLIIVVILHLTGTISDYYHIKTENDLNYLFQPGSDD